MQPLALHGLQLASNSPVSSILGPHHALRATRLTTKQTHLRSHRLSNPLPACPGDMSAPVSVSRDAADCRGASATASRTLQGHHLMCTVTWMTRLDPAGLTVLIVKWYVVFVFRFRIVTLVLSGFVRSDPRALNESLVPSVK
jgi:hypothetical protein